MMVVSRAVVSLFSGMLLLSTTVGAESICGPYGVQSSGSIYRICMPPPERYNGRLVLWAHGFQDATDEVGIPEEQMDFGDFTLPELVNQLGFAFATNSYSKTGLAVRQGMADLLDLVDIFRDEQGAPEGVLLTGASEGGIITALLVEQHPQVFDGGLAVCGPLGDFAFQLRYFGDARATFEYFFPGLIPGDPFRPTNGLINRWDRFYEREIEPVIFDPDNADLLMQWTAVASLPFDPEDVIATLGQSAADVLNYSVVNLKDAVETLGGFPYGNVDRRYRGSDDDDELNRQVPRVAADEAALNEMDAFYDTTGDLVSPLVTLHTLLDQQVPYTHQVLYMLKTLRSGSLIRRHVPVPVDRFGHCNVTPGEALLSFAILLYLADLDSLAGVGSILEGADLSRFETLAQEMGVPYRVEGEALRLERSPSRQPLR